MFVWGDYSLRRDADLDSQGIEFSKLHIFSGIGEEDILSYLDSVEASLKWYPRGERVPYSFRTSASVGVLVRGQAQILLEDPFGHEAMGYMVEEGVLFGTVPMVMKEISSGSILDMRTKTAVLWIPYNKLVMNGKRHGHIHERIVKNCVEGLSHKLFLLLQNIEVLSKRTVRERLELYLYHMGNNQHSRRVRVPGRVQLAKQLGCNRSALTREIGRMEDDGTLVCGDGWMEINWEKQKN